MRYEQAGERSKHFHCEASGMLLARTYRVSSAAVPVMIIAECFPLNSPFCGGCGRRQPSG